MADDEPDRLSQLPDDLLHHILHLAACREAESTAVLSRRWRGLWPPPTTSAVTFNIPSIRSERFHHRERDATICRAKEALVAAHGPVTRLSIHVGEGCGLVDNIVDDVLSYRAARFVQDVRIAGDDSVRKARYNDDDWWSWSWSWLPDHRVGHFECSLGSVASAALRLRVLHITNCSGLTPPPQATMFPCLEVLWLQNCSVDLQRLQDMVIASPRLAALQLEYVFLSTVVRRSPTTAAQQWPEDDWQGCHNYNDVGYYNYIDGYSEQRLNLPQSFSCPGITTLVLLNCCSDKAARNYIAIELDVPKVKHLRYRGGINQFTLRSALPDVRRVYLHILANDYRARDDKYRMFWNFLKNFGNTKVMKLNLEWPIDYVAVPDRKRFMELLGETFFDIEHLEIDAPHKPTSKDAAVAIGNFLQCCPVILDLTVKLNPAEQPWRSINSRTNKAQLEFEKSIDHFKRRRDRPVMPLRGDDDKVQNISDISGLSDRWFHFTCFRFHLRRLSMQFQMDKPDCVGAQLAKFFVERGMALEEMYMDDGNMRLWEHMNCKISGYEANPHPIIRTPNPNKNVTSA